MSSSDFQRLVMNRVTAGHTHQGSYMNYKKSQQLEEELSAVRHELATVRGENRNLHALLRTTAHTSACELKHYRLEWNFTGGSNNCGICNQTYETSIFIDTAIYTNEGRYKITPVSDLPNVICERCAFDLFEMVPCPKFHGQEGIVQRLYTLRERTHAKPKSARK